MLFDMNFVKLLSYRSKLRHVGNEIDINRFAETFQFSYNYDNGRYKDEYGIFNDQR